jgi:ABC-type phosphate transport system auxiliary subunit
MAESLKWKIRFHIAWCWRIAGAVELGLVVLLGVVVLPGVQGLAMVAEQRGLLWTKSKFHHG